MYLPPLNALRAFEAAGRHQSFLLAGKELHVSAASISRFIKMLEDELKQELFTRQANGVLLTPAGAQYLTEIQPHLYSISRISYDLKKQDNKETLTIISIPAVAETWLVTRLWSFQQKHKDIQINLIVNDQLLVNDQLIKLDANDKTIVLNYSDGKQPETDSYAMPKDKLTLVCNPEIAANLSSIDEIFNYNFLIDIDWQEDWQTWLKEAFVNKNLESNLKKFNKSKHSKFERYSMILHATLAGSGIAIGHTTLLKSYLNSGALVAPFDIQAVSKKQFYALVSKDTQVMAVEAFIEWFIKGD